MNPAEDALLILSQDQRKGNQRIGRPNALDVFETLASASYDIKVAADSAYADYRESFVAYPQWPSQARAAAQRVLAALDEYEREMG